MLLVQGLFVVVSALSSDRVLEFASGHFGWPYLRTEKLAGRFAALKDPQAGTRMGVSPVTFSPNMFPAAGRLPRWLKGPPNSGPRSQSQPDAFERPRMSQ